MLVLSRRVGEAIYVGDDIVIYVTRTTANRVVLGIDAPTSKRVLRGELTTDGCEQPISLPGWDADNTSVAS